MSFNAYQEWPEGLPRAFSGECDVSLECLGPLPSDQRIPKSLIRSTLSGNGFYEDSVNFPS